MSVDVWSGENGLTRLVDSGVSGVPDCCRLVDSLLESLLLNRLFLR